MHLERASQVLAQLERVLGVFQKLLASRATDQQACKLLSSIFLAFDGAELQVLPPSCRATISCAVL